MEDAYDVEKGEKNWPKIMIVGVEDYEDDESFVELLKNKNDSINEDSKIRVVKVYGANKPEKRIIVETDINTFERVMQRRSLVVGWIICNVFEHVTVRMCYKCHGFGHAALNCEYERVCSQCSGPHDSSDCMQTDQFTCINCKRFNKMVNETERVKENHPVFSLQCPIYR